MWLVSAYQGRGYFAGFRMTGRRNNVRDIIFFAIFTDNERKKSQMSTYTPVIKRKVQVLHT